MDEVIVFSGPTLSASDRGNNHRFCAPAAQGDIFNAVGRCRVIGLVDGYFEGVPAIWHKEILYALSQGIHVFGASSLGALRAVELDSLGMRGVGQIYEWYKAGIIDGDDEVALVHSPAELNYLGLSEPLVNVRATLLRATEEEVISAFTAQSLLSIGKQIFYKERTWERLMEVARQTALTLGVLPDWIKENRVDQKKLDALAMVEAIDSFLLTAPEKHLPNFSFEPTDAWISGIASWDSGRVVDNSVLDEARLLPDYFKRISEKAALVLLSRSQTRTDFSPMHLSRALDSFRQKRGLNDGKMFADWLSANETSREEVREMVADRSGQAETLSKLGDDLLHEIMNQTKIDDQFRALSSRAKDKQERLSTHQDWPFLTLQQLLTWFFLERLGAEPPDDPEMFCRELLLSDLPSLKQILAREYIFDNLRRGSGVRQDDDREVAPEN